MTASRFARNAAAAASVLLLHAGALWAFNHGLTHKPALRQPETIVMAQLLMPLGEEGAAPAGEPAATPEPPAAQPAPPPPPKEKPKPKPKPKPKLKPTPKPVAKPEPTPEPAVLAVEDSAAARAANAPVVAAAPPAPAESSGAGEPATQHASHGGGNAGSSSSGSGKGLQGSGTGGGGVVLPSSSAAYLRNPKPAYPSMSRRLGESGRSVIRVLVGADGSAKNVRLQRSSGFDRLDQAALDAVRRWRFVPGTRGGVPEDMWFNIPIVWQLN